MNERCKFCEVGQHDKCNGYTHGEIKRWCVCSCKGEGRASSTRSGWCRDGEHKACSGFASTNQYPCQCACHEKFEDATIELEHDPVNRPSHYTTDPSGVECITITRHRNFNIGNAIKYLWRAGLKTGNGDPLAKQIEDLEKARWYIADEIERLRGESPAVTEMRRENLEKFSEEIEKAGQVKPYIYRVKSTSKTFPGKCGELVTDDVSAINTWASRGYQIVLRFPNEGIIRGFRLEDVGFVGYGKEWLE